jgi:hypothetical protein
MHDMAILVEMGSERPFTLLLPVPNQSFTNGSKADKAPKPNAWIVQLATHFSMALCAASSHSRNSVDGSCKSQAGVLFLDQRHV